MMQKDTRIRRIACILLTLLLCACVSAQPAAPEPTAPPVVTTVPPTSTPEIVAVATPTPTPSPEPTEAPTPEPTPTPTPGPSPTPAPEPFTIVWASDTQSMIAYADMTDGYTAMCDWIASEAEARRFVLYLHTGDMVDNGDHPGQWSVFRAGLQKITEKMPFFWSFGNHDYGKENKKRWYYQPFLMEFPEEQKFHNGECTYMIFTHEQTKLLLISIGYRQEYGHNTAAWARSICEAYSDLPVILITHGYLTADGSLMNIAEILESDLVAACPNVRLVLCGHSRGISRSAFRYDDDGDGKPDRTVNALMYDVQTDREQYGYLCLLTYDPLTDMMSVDSYSPYLDDAIHDDENPDLERFTLEHVFY